MRLLIDRPFPALVAVRLREMGHDAQAAAEREDLAGLDDAALLARAAAEGRVLMSGNVGDMLPLAEEAARRGEGGPGVALAAPARYPRTPLALDRLVRDLDAFLAGGHDPEALARRGVHWLEPPPGCPFWPAPR